MADDAQFDPFSGGILTPQALQMARLQQMIQMQQGTLKNGQPNAGMAGANQSLGLGIGDQLGSLFSNLANRNGRQGGNFMDRVAASNAQILNAPLQQPGGVPSAPAAGAAPAAGGGAAGAPSATPAQAPMDPLAQQVMLWQQRANAFAATGNWEASQAAQNQATMLLTKRAGLQKTVEETNKAISDQDLDAARAQNQRADSMSKTVQIPVDQEGNYKTLGFNVETGKYDIDMGIGKKTPQTSIALNNQQDRVPLFQAVAKELGESTPKALQAQTNIKRIDAASSLLSQGIISGTGAGARASMDNLFATLGFSNGDTLARTQAFLTQTKQLAIGLGKGAFTRITNWEAQLLQGITGGDNAMASSALKSILKELRTGQVQQLQQYNTRRGQLAKDPTIGQQVDSLYPNVEIPSEDDNPNPAALNVGDTHTVGGFTIKRVK